MAQFDTNIDVTVRVFDKALKRLENRLQKLNKIANPPVEISQQQAAEQARLLRGDQLLLQAAKARAVAEQKVVQAQKDEFKQQQALAREERSRTQRTLRRENATELIAQRNLKLERAGALEIKTRAKAVEKLNRVADANITDPAILERVATGLGRILSTQNELNRASIKDIGQKQRISDYNKQIAQLKAVGATEGQLRKARKRAAEFTESAAKRQNTIADKRELQLKREIKLLQDKYKLELKAFNATANLPKSSPLSAGPARTVLDTPKALAQKAAYYERIGKSVKALSSPMRPQSVLGSDASLRKKAEYYERIAKAAQKTAFPRSPIRGTRTMEGSPKYLENERRKNLKLNRDAEKKLRQELAKRNKAEREANRELKKQERLRQKNAAAAAKTAKQAQKKAAADKKASKANFGKKFTDIAAGVGFPLLFGGGPGSVLGGLLGGLFGGFGGSVLFSALGQQLDKLGAAATDTASSLLRVTANLDNLIPKLGRGAPQGFSERAEFLRGQGFESRVGAVTERLLEETYGQENIDRLKKLGEQTKVFGKIWEELGVKIELLIAGPLGALLKALEFFTGGELEKKSGLEKSRDKFQDQADALLPRIKELEGQVERKEIGKFNEELNVLVAKRAALLAVIDQYNSEISGELANQVTLTQLINQFEKERAEIFKQEEELARTKLTARRDDYAAARGTLATTKAQYEVDNIAAELAAEEAKDNVSALKVAELTTKLKEAQKNLNVAIAESANQILEAERAINREISLNVQAQIAARNASFNRASELKSIRTPRAAQFGIDSAVLKENLKVQEELLEMRRKQELVGVNEQELVDEINTKYAEQLRLLRFTYDLDAERARQKAILVNLQQRELQQTLDIQRLTEGNRAAEQIRNLDFERDFSLSGAGFGFFGESEAFADKTLERTAMKLAEMNTEVANLTKNITYLKEQGADAKLVEVKEDELKRLALARDLFAQFQPAIDQAAIAQARFNDAFNLVNPVIQNITGNLQSIVDGTKSVEEAFADMLRNIANILIQQGAVMIAQYIAIGIARAFAMGTSFESAKPPSELFSRDFTGAFMAGAGLRSTGGPVLANSPYIVGERGPELFLPKQHGQIYSNNDTRQMLGRTMPARTIRFETTMINNVEYVTKEEAMAIGRQAADDGARRGAKMGTSQTLNGLQNSRSQRSRLGMR